MSKIHNGVIIPAELDNATTGELDAYAAKVKQENGEIIRAYFELEEQRGEIEPERVTVSTSRDTDGTLHATCQLDAEEEEEEEEDCNDAEEECEYDAFTLRIEMGNAAMQTTDDVADALRAVLLVLDNGGTHQTIRDLNGNTVGKWELT